MQIRCYRCGMSYAMGKDEIGFALAALRAEADNHYDAPCPRCRTKNRVAIDQLEKEVRNRGLEVPDLSKDDSAEAAES